MSGSGPVLRTAAAHLADEGRALPPVRAVVPGRAIELYLDEPASPVAPFTTGEDTQHWTCPARKQDVLDEEELDEVDLPLPGLVTLGTTTQEHPVLVDLESIGVLRLTGPARHLVARNLAVELGLTPLADTLEVSLAEGLAPGLAGVCERLIAHTEASDILGPPRSHHTEQQRALGILVADSLRAARLTSAGGWTPHIVLVDGETDTVTAKEVCAIAGQEPRTATAIIVTGEDQDEDPTVGWAPHTTDDSPVTVPGTDVECVPRLLGDNDYADILDLLATADTHHDVASDLPPQDDQDLRRETTAPSSAAGPHEAGEQAELPSSPPPPGPDTASWRRAGAGPSVIVQPADLGLEEDDPEAPERDQDSTNGTVEATPRTSSDPPRVQRQAATKSSSRQPLGR